MSEDGSNSHLKKGPHKNRMRTPDFEGLKFEEKNWEFLHSEKKNEQKEHKKYFKGR